MSADRRTDACWQIFGSRAGYTTLDASPDISPDDIATLETFGFGDTSSRDYFQSLHSQPAGMGKPLPSGRYALTRCLPGPADSAGRATLLFATLLFESQVWLDRVAHCVYEVLQEPQNWDLKAWNQGGRTVVRLPSRTMPPPRTRSLALLDAWLAVGSSVVVCDGDELNDRAVAALPSLLPPPERSRIRWGIRTLSVGAPVDVCTLAPSAGRSGRRRVLHPREGAAHHPYAEALALFWKDTEPPTHFIQQCASTNITPHQAAEQTSAAGNLSATRTRRGRRIIISAAIASIILIGVVVTVGMLGTDSKKRSQAPVTTPSPAPTAPSVTRSREIEVEPEPVEAPPDAQDEVEAWIETAGEWLQHIENDAESLQHDVLAAEERRTHVVLLDQYNPEQFLDDDEATQLYERLVELNDDQLEIVNEVVADAKRELMRRWEQAVERRIVTLHHHWMGNLERASKWDDASDEVVRVYFAIQTQHSSAIEEFIDQAASRHWRNISCVSAALMEHGRSLRKRIQTLVGAPAALEQDPAGEEEGDRYDR